MSDEDRALNSLAHLLQADGLPGVITTNRPLRDISRDVLAYLSRVPTLNLYIRHGQLVRIQQSEEGAPCLEVLSEAICKGVLTRHLNFVKLTAKGTPQHAAPPDIVVRDIMALGSWPFPPIETLIEFPVFRPDGTLVDRPGYDRLMRLVYVPVKTLKIPPILDRPSQQDIAVALALLHELIGEFPFEDKASYANALALLLTPLIRQYIHGHVPLALIDATRPGTGKSLLAEIVAMIATGRQAAMMPAPYDDDEWRKRIASTLAKGATVITIDNIKGKLQAASLDLALTSYVFEDRILGQSKMGTYAQRATWMATGNNIQLGGDLPRRSYWIRMDAHTDKPCARTSFKHDLNTWVPEHRGELIAALLTLARAWFAGGKPAANVPPIGSFQSWVDTIGGILSYAGIEGFLGNLPTLYEQADEDATQWAAFLRAWREHYEDQEVMVATLVKDLKAGALDGAMLGVGLYNALPDELADIQKGDFRRRLGKALSARIGSQFDESGLHLVKASLDSRSGSAYWKVVDAQMPQRVLPQHEDVSGQIASSEDRGSAVNGNAPPKIFSPEEGNLSAKAAHLRNYQAPFGCE
ncbi:MAG TPA: hypothetical protein VFN02_05135, partial [Ktedonobacteraceae bacterium]|nr:hypothetical protein [Ktedonobacteraceae bacterium]